MTRRSARSLDPRWLRELGFCGKLAQAASEKLLTCCAMAAPPSLSFFGPTSPPLLNEANPFLRRTLQRARIVGSFAVVQALVQAVGFASGILLVRRLNQQEYAYFTIANTMQGTINVLADIGISIGLISIGGRVWQDSHRFGQLIATAQNLRRKLGGVALLLVTPILYWM